MSIRIALTTLPSIEASKKIAKLLIKKKLAACVNIVPNIHSVYFWKGTINEDAEWLLIIKTTLGKIKKLEKELSQIHPYELPEFVVLSPTKTSKAYAKWIEATVRSRDAGR